jgi:hypothetical protein
VNRPFSKPAHLRWLLAGYVVLVASVGGLLAVDVEVLDLFRDPWELGAVLVDHPWKGAISTLGIFAWAGGSAASLLAGAVLRSRGQRRRGSFLLALGGLLLVFGLDDAFGIHENLTEVVLGTEHAEPIVTLALAAAFAAWAIVFRAEILRSDWGFVLLATLGLGAAVCLDLVREVGLAFRGLGIMEETVELAGILTFVIYAARESWLALAGEEVASTGPRATRPAS